MWIDNDTGLLTLGGLEIGGTTSPGDWSGLEGFHSKGNPVLSFATPELDNFTWIPGFDRGLLRSLFMWRADLVNLRQAAKSYHDDLLRSCLGVPDGETRAGPRWGPFAPPRADRSWIATSPNLVWNRAWGQASSFFDMREYQPMIRIEWTNRRA